MWQGRSNAGHRHNEPDWLRFYASELLLYAPPIVNLAVELGCGRGDLFTFMTAAFESYVGVDFSEAMTAAFREQSPAAMVARADATHVPLADGIAEFVFCNQLAQYLSLADLRLNIAEASRILRPGGTYLIANIPDASLRWAYRGGALRSDLAFSISRALNSLVSTELLRKDDGIGLWYHRSQVARLATSSGFAVETFSSSGYEYRFHAVLKKNPSSAANDR